MYAIRSYYDTTGVVGYPGIKYIPTVNGKKDFSEVIEQAKKCPSPVELETGKIIGGFAHNQVLTLADTVVDAVNSGAIKKFFVMAGCVITSYSIHYTKLYECTFERIKRSN